MVLVVGGLDWVFAICLEHFGGGRKTVVIPIIVLVGVHIGGVSARIFTRAHCINTQRCGTCLSYKMYNFGISHQRGTEFQLSLSMSNKIPQLVFRVK